MNIQGLVAVGTLQGLRPTMWDGKINGYELGLLTRVDDGFGGHKDEQILIKVREDAQAALQNTCNHAKGKLVAVSVTFNAYKTQKGAVGSNINYKPDSTVLVLDDVDPLTGEVLDPKKKDLKVAS